uniref:NADH-ubiquinone oxidoreductase chain 2 n=1 Tax=Luidia maculata TaxID=60584 RepID=A0A7M1IKD9_9ECHI|nr:NADH dehydrogenase subunit 2 [Luidia maculata]
MHRNIMLVLVFNVFFSSAIVISSHHWFTVWVGLEMNTLSVLPLLCFQFSPRNVESTVKYFLVQSFSAAIILNLALMQAWMYSSWSVVQSPNFFISSVLIMALGLKMGLFPCHYWFPDVVQGAGFLQGLLLSTWQKVAPLVVLGYVCSADNSGVLLVMGAASVLVGGWGGLNQTQTRKILAFSSIAHVGWICVIMSYSFKVSLVMFLVYVIINTTVFLLSNEFRLSSLSMFGRLLNYNPVSGVLVILGVLSLGGLPPLFGFLIKFLALECLVCEGAYFLSFVLVLGSLISLFFYLRVGFNSSLIYFPQHSISVFVWRSIMLSGGANSPYVFMLSALAGFNLLGVLCAPLLVSLLNN